MTQKPVWTETIRRVGNEPEYHYEVSPCPDGLAVELRYREWDDKAKQWLVKTTIGFAPELAPRLAEALTFVARHLAEEQGP
jgi:hypothetical protein